MDDKPVDLRGSPSAHEVQCPSCYGRFAAVVNPSPDAMRIFREQYEPAIPVVEGVVLEDAAGKLLGATCPVCGTSSVCDPHELGPIPTIEDELDDIVTRDD